MRRFVLSLVLLLGLLLVGLALAQEREPAYELIQQLGKPRPRGIAYDPNADRFAWVDPLGQLQLVDAATYETQFTLYETGFYNAYQFSHNGQYLALAIDLRVEIWETATGELLTQIEPDGALRVEGPLYWSPDDTLLSFNTQVRAPRELRRSENDTTNLPWVWDVASALRIRRSVLPGARAIPFFDYRNGFVYGANNKAVVGLPERLQILDITPDGVNVIGEIPANRFEPDPVTVWTSWQDSHMYIRPDEGSSSIVQLDTETGNLLYLPIGFDRDARSLASLRDLQLSPQTRTIGAVTQTRYVPVLGALLGENYRDQFAYHPLTVTLVDVLESATPTALGDNGFALLLHIHDETRGTGRMELITQPWDGNQWALSPLGDELLIRRSSGTGRIERYSLEAGDLLSTYLPALPDFDGSRLLAFDGTGEIILSDFQRFDAATGEVLLQDLEYNGGYERFWFNEDSQTIITLSGDRWWEWDIASGNVIRRETFQPFGEPLDNTADGERFLSRIDETTFEVYEIGQEERTRIRVRSFPQMTLEQILPSPDWEHYLAIYDSNSFGQHGSGGEILVYSVTGEILLHAAGDDLPPTISRAYGWVDEETIFISAGVGTSNSPERVYGVDYAESGIPACLVEAFPQTYSRWILVWERFNDRLSPDRLHRLSQDVCALLPAAAAEVESFLFPTATPTRLPVTATPSVIAGVPACLTNRFPSEAQEYAAIWRELTEGLTEEEIAELEVLTCENLTGASAPEQEVVVEEEGSNRVVMTIHIHTGVREVGPTVPQRERPTPPNLDLVREAFRLQFGRTPTGTLSPDQQLFAGFTQLNHIAVYRLLTPYEALAANATATMQVQQAQEEDARSVSLRATATESFSFLGTPRPTLTPTVTPTVPPLPQATADLPQQGEIEYVCPYTQRFTVDDPPPDFAPEGRIFSRFSARPAPRGTWILQPESGDLVLDDTSTPCADCDLSYNREWAAYQDGNDVYVLRPDGSDLRRVEYPFEYPYSGIRNYRWLAPDTLEFSYQVYRPEERERPFTVRQLYDPNTNAYGEPFISPQPVTINQLQTIEQAAQPGLSNRYIILRTDYNTGQGIGTRYYLYDRQTERAEHIASLDRDLLTLEWHPFGDVLYYRFPVDETWYAFDASTGEHRVLEVYENGLWSLDGRSRARRISLAGEEREDRIDAGEPLPFLEIWDRETGLLRRYCFPAPEFERAGYWDTNLPEPLAWSPDDRYLVFQMIVPWDEVFPAAPQRTYLLDVVTGSVTEITAEAVDLRAWVRDEGGYR